MILRVKANTDKHHKRAEGQVSLQQRNSLQLAKMKKQKSRFAEVLNGLFPDWWFAFILFARPAGDDQFDIFTSGPPPKSSVERSGRAQRRQEQVNAARMGCIDFEGDALQSKKRKIAAVAAVGQHRQDHYHHFSTNNGVTSQTQVMMERTIKILQCQLDLAKSVDPPRVPALQRELMRLYDRLAQESLKALDEYDENVEQSAKPASSASATTVPFVPKRSVLVDGRIGAAIAAAAARTSGQVLAAPTQPLVAADTVDSGEEDDFMEMYFK